MRRICPSVLGLVTLPVFGASKISVRGLPYNSVRRHCYSLGPYTSNLILNSKVLDFIKSGGPKLTVGRTIFEMRLVL